MTPEQLSKLPQYDYDSIIKADQPDASDQIRAAFVAKMRGKLYGRQETLAAFAWFWNGWAASSGARAGQKEEPRSLDTDRRVCFYEQEFYPLSNFSSFKVSFAGLIFDTSEHTYHWNRFPHGSPERTIIRESASAHEAFRFAQENKHRQLPNWDAIKVPMMGEILRAKTRQHEYVRRKLLQTGDRELVENSWRDPFWGWGPNRDGLNMLGKLWMEVRAELRQ